MDPPATNGADHGLWVNSRDQRTIAAVLLTLTSVHIVWLCVVSEDLVDIDRTRPASELRFELDVNSADWPELLLLPEIGETLARRIVAWRTRNGRFQSLQELRRVKGIGPAKLARIRPYLRPIRAAHELGEESP